MSQTARLGAFLILTFAALILGVFLIGRHQSRFESTYRLQAEFQKVAGLTEGADVRVGGIRKGTVRHIELPKQTDGKVNVLMDQLRDTQKVLKRDSLDAIK